MAVVDHAAALVPAIPAQLQQRDVDRALAGLAWRQHGTVARGQLIAVGFTRHAIEYMVARGWLRTVHRGVYAVGHARLTTKSRWMAAVLAAGPGAVLSHRAAGALWRLGVGRAATIDVSTNRSLRPREGITLHRTQLASDEITTVDGIPVTTVARTLMDLAAVLPRQELERTMHEAEVQRLSDATGLHALIDRYPRRSGRRALRAIVAEEELGRAMTRSEFELHFLAFVKHRELPRPAINHQVPTAVRTYECDFVWPEARLIVELDGFETHGTRRGFEEDRARDRALTIAGWRVIRITWRQLRDDPQQLAKDLWELLARPTL